ncbi:30S ribosomal protein S6 [Pelagicoccus sp. SDUM812003]|uniref:30S ribosomal protein S6 n=1 Tax=Pelagicoccus sp. SDUM812003 TaxID=3041267 RepID=UPI00280C7F98|nr:30S ribosomal protein S6 [Pelagicoccus sp. SDUM812003]MDQ8203654.1 30S ribosomal protein S6 [Pelagicoccus sp. SDUM812003]
MTATASNYRATFILDTRGREESVEDLIEGLKAELSEAGAEVTKVEDLGRKDFARIPDVKYESGVYVQYEFSGSAETPAAVLEKLRLNKLVSHKMIQKA